MRGEVLHYDDAHGFGFITGEDGNRYTFRREDLRRAFPLSRGTAVEFRQSGDRAQDVSSPVTAAQVSAPAEAVQAPAHLTATPIATPAARPAPQRYGRNAVGNGVVEGPSIGLWSYFRAGITTNYANFHGRARRKEYWGFALFYTLGMILLAIAGLAIDAAVGNFDYSAEAPVATIVIVLLAMLASVIPGIAVSVRRFHDIGLSGWFYLVMVVVGFILAGSVMILAIVLGLIPSQKRENQWGPVPDGMEVPPQAR
jgi:uncharacterized membrane protein YhaH (DUF805 family)/cold shock CspA family protein